ncbi:MAG: TetR/AcrR family transcriptional regulator [Actinobacteria bacterium]|nr:TetR/AcrR family transcriptional regulator [Actinomycetota bacterium]
MTETTETTRPRRADAERNRGRLIEAAAEAFRESGFEVGVAEIARRAGVGSATLFRNFPTKDDLVFAVIEARLAEALEICKRAQAIEDPAESFEYLMFGIADFQARDLGFYEAMHSRVIDEPALFMHKNRLVEISGQVLWPRPSHRTAPTSRRPASTADICASCSTACGPTALPRSPLRHRTPIRVCDNPRRIRGVAQPGSAHRSGR